MLVVILLLPLSVVAAVIGPIKTSGSINFLTQYNKSAAGAASSSRSYMYRGSADSYIWQPWFITWSGSLGLGLSTRDSGSSTRNVTGSVSFDILPRSRFPLLLSYSVSNSKTESQINSNTLGVVSSEREADSTSFSAYQRYSARDGTLYSGWLTSNYTNAPAQSGVARVWGRDTSRGISAARRFEFHAVEAMLREFSSRSVGSESTRRAASLSHNYSPESEFGVNSGLTMNESVTTASSVSSRSVTLGSRFFWRPDYSSFSVNGSINAGENTSSGSGTRKVDAQLAGSYGLSRSVRISAGVGVSLVETEVGKTGSSSQNIGISYSSDRFLLGKYTWGWNTGAGLSNSLSRGGGRDSSSASANISLGHSANRQFELGERSSIGLSLSQSGGVSQVISASGSDVPLGGGVQKNISHSASVNYSHSGETGTTSIWSSLNDSRDLNRGTSQQGLQVSLSRDERVSRTSGLMGSINYNYSQSSTADGKSSSSNSGGSMSYFDSRFLGVHRLRLQSELRLSEAAGGDTGLALSSSLSNRLTYQLGLLSATFSASYSHRTSTSGVDQRYTFSVTRAL
ncbi:MAG: hypothetical protein L3J62_00505 [Gammaproteobacteria bacterium]|nr:hypothetical protein [Gammaproteobacteria bacterium]